MAQPKPTKLTGHTARSQAGAYGVAAVIIGLLVAVAGAGIVLVATDVIHVSSGSFHAPRWVVGLIGGIFGFVGLLVIRTGAFGVVRERRRKQVQALHPEEPWLADYAWDANGIADDGKQTLRSSYAGAVFFTVFLIPFNWIGLKADMGPMRWPWMFIVGIFDLVTLLLWASAIKETIRAGKYGKSYIRFERFPFTLGDRLDIAFSAPKGIGAFDKMAFTLRCIQERYETHGSGDNRTTSTVCYERYKDAIAMDQRGVFEGGHSQVPLHFDLPDDPELATELAARPPRYWELEVSADTPGVDFKATFLLPVYAQASTPTGSSAATRRDPVWSS